MDNFWETLPKPFTVLAPMEGVTDAVFRQMIRKIGRPDVFFTEFVMTDGIVSKGREKTAESLQFKPNEKPIVAQIWGTNPEHFKITARYIKTLGFSGVDINMGCPVHDVVKHGACSGLIKNPPLAKEIIEATKEGSGGLPVSVKTRIGFNIEAIDEWISFLLKQDISALSLHLRTSKEMSKVPAHWELMSKVISLRNTISPQTFLIGNGDVSTYEDIISKYKTYGCDGIMVGRGIFSNPWLFNPSVSINEKTIPERLDLYLEHIALFKEIWGTKKNPASLRKFCKTYINNFAEASSFRERLMETKNIEELTQLILEYKSRFTSPSLLPQQSVNMTS